MKEHAIAAADAINSQDEAGRADFSAIVEDLRNTSLLLREVLVFFTGFAVVQFLVHIIIALVSNTHPLPMFVFLPALGMLGSIHVLVTLLGHCSAFDLRVVMFRIAVTVLDITSFFYILFVLSKFHVEPRECALGGRSVSYLTCAWVWHFGAAIVAAVCGLVFVLSMLDVQAPGRKVAKLVSILLEVAFLVLIYSTDAISRVLVFSLSAPLDHAVELFQQQEVPDSAAMGKLFSFIVGDNCPSPPRTYNNHEQRIVESNDGDPHHHHTMAGRYRFVHFNLTKNMERYCAQQQPSRVALLQKVRFVCRPRDKKSATYAHTSPEHQEEDQDNHLRQDPKRDTRINKPWGLFYRFGLTPWREKLRWLRSHKVSSESHEHRIATVLFWVTLPFKGFSALYPPLHIAYITLWVGHNSSSSSSTYSLPWSVTATTIVFCWVVIVALGRRAFLYFGFLMDLGCYPLLQEFTLDDARQILRSAFVPNTTEVLLASVPWSLLPPDVLESTAMFLSENGVGAIDTTCLSVSKACDVANALKKKQE